MRQFDRYSLRRVFEEVRPVHWPLGAWVLATDFVRSLRGHPDATRGMDIPTERALGVVMEWLAAAQDANRDGGFACYYSLYGGFSPSFPETTGYIIPTLVEFGARPGAEEYLDRAVRAGNWLLTLQDEVGAFPAGFGRPWDGPSVFNTGQILFGMNALTRLTNDERFARSAIRAGEWLLSVQSENGSWSRHTYENDVHIYYTMVAWALAELSLATGRSEFRDAALRKVGWALSNQRPDGWLTTFNLKNRPTFLHFIAYTLQGLAETARLLSEDGILENVERLAGTLRDELMTNGRLAGAYTEDGRPVGNFSCPTGNAQMALVWWSLAAQMNDARYVEAGRRMNGLLKVNLRFDGFRSIRGAIRGSDPTWGPYHPFRFPNWAAKFTADSFLEESKVTTRDGTPASQPT